MKPYLLCLSLLLCNSVLAFETPQALQDAFMAAMRANDAAGMAACYTATATSFQVDSMSGVGPAYVQESWTHFFANYHIISAELTGDHKEVSADLAVAWGLFTLKVQPVVGGEPMVMQGRYTDAARKINGQWLYIADHASMPLPPPPEQ